MEVDSGTYLLIWISMKNIIKSDKQNMLQNVLESIDLEKKICENALFVEMKTPTLMFQRVNQGWVSRS